MSNAAIQTLRDQLDIDERELAKLWGDYKAVIEEGERAQKIVDAQRRRVGTLKQAIEKLEVIERIAEDG